MQPVDLAITSVSNTSDCCLLCPVFCSKSVETWCYTVINTDRLPLFLCFLELTMGSPEPQCTEEVTRWKQTCKIDGFNSMHGCNNMYGCNGLKTTAPLALGVNNKDYEFLIYCSLHAKWTPFKDPQPLEGSNREGSKWLCTGRWLSTLLFLSWFTFLKKRLELRL